VETAFSGIAPRWNKWTTFSGIAPRWNREKISASIRLLTEKSTIIKRKFTPSLTSNDTNISQ
jgi:hypothetical protein